MIDHEDRAHRLNTLRHRLDTLGLDGLIVPHSDDYLNENLPACAERLAWITGFTGSAGCAIILRDTAALFVDGRYSLQAELETDPALFERHHLINRPPRRWIAETLRPETRLGFDPWLHTEAEVTAFRQACREAQSRLIACRSNPIDAIWNDRPPEPTAPIVPHPEHLAGESSREKRQRIAAGLNADALIITAPDSLAWLLNIRGNDVRDTPLALARAVLYRDGSVAFCVDPVKLDPNLLSTLGTEVTVHPALGFARVLMALGGRSVRVDPAQTPFWVIDRLHVANADIITDSDPCQLAKACKNSVELDGMRAAHRRDGVALCRFLAWLDTAENVDEITASDRLHDLRSDDPLFRGNSFATISGSGPNAAIIHYHATEHSRRPLLPGELYLIDSGAHYPDGTTDVTRTVPLAAHQLPPAPEMRHHFTLVLRGHIALARVIFPEGTSGSQLDVLARTFLWAEGLDYDHGTGHGVGCYLGVHEGPQRISKQANTVALQPGMVVSNEPGYYKPGAYGIRIENLLAVVPNPQPGMLMFEPLTLAPIDRRLIEPELLDGGERAWLDDYHCRVYEAIGPLVDDKTRKWLKKATAAL